MLSYAEFKEVFKERLPRYMGSEYKDYEVQSQIVVKRGVERDAFIFVPKDKEMASNRCIPTLYYDDIYEAYLKDENLDRELSYIAYSIDCAYEEQENMADCCTLEHMKDNVIFELINDESTFFYSNYPFRRFLDTVVAYRWAIRIDNTGVYSGLIDNEAMKTAGLTEEDLYNKAFAKTRELLGYKVLSLEHMIRKMMTRDGADIDSIEKHLSRVSEYEKVFFVTNSRQYRASTGLLYEDFLREIADKVGDDFYVLPASVNDFIVFGAGGKRDVNMLLRILLDINKSYKDSKDQLLSRSIYFYSRANGKLEICGSYNPEWEYDEDI